MLRHLVAEANVGPDGRILAAAQVHHGVIVGRQVAALAGPVDPLTHLNEDYPAHLLDAAIVVERLTIGAPVLLSGDGFLVARIGREALEHRGPVDFGARRSEWQAVLHRR